MDALLEHVIMLLTALTPFGNSEARNIPAKHFSGNFVCPGIDISPNRAYISIHEVLSKKVRVCWKKALKRS